MILTIIPIDGAVYKDGLVYTNLNLSFVPTNIHALQFNTVSNAGWLEFKLDDFGNKENNQVITELPEWANICLDKWDEAKVQKETAELEKIGAQ